MALEGKRILVTGGTGLIGTNLHEALRARGLASTAVGSRDADLTSLDETRRLFREIRPEVVVHLAAMVGGIHANRTRKCDFYEVNTLINTHVVLEARRHGVEAIFAAGTGCAYPKHMEGELLLEARFLDGTPEATNDAYAYSKRNLLVHLRAMAEQHGGRFAYLLPANIYGPHDNFHPEDSHVVPGLIVRFLQATEAEEEEVVIWGSGEPERDFLYIGDCVAGFLAVMESPEAEGVYNIASGARTRIRELAETIARVTGFAGRLRYDTTRPDGQSTRIMATDRVQSLGWAPSTSLEEGIRRTVEWCRANRGAWTEPAS